MLWHWWLISKRWMRVSNQSITMSRSNVSRLFPYGGLNHRYCWHTAPVHRTLGPAGSAHGPFYYLPPLPSPHQTRQHEVIQILWECKPWFQVAGKTCLTCIKSHFWWQPQYLTGSFRSSNSQPDQFDCSSGRTWISQHIKPQLSDRFSSQSKRIIWSRTFSIKDR